MKNKFKDKKKYYMFFLITLLCIMFENNKKFKRIMMFNNILGISGAYLKPYRYLIKNNKNFTIDYNKNMSTIF